MDCFSTVDDLELDMNSGLTNGGGVPSSLSAALPMKTMNVYYVFIDSESSIQFIECEKETLSLLNSEPLDKRRGIQKDRLLQMIHNKKQVSGRKYKLFHMLQFHVNIGGEYSLLENFVKQNDVEYKEFTRSPSYLTDLVVDDSLDIFHDLNSLFIFLY